MSKTGKVQAKNSSTASSAQERTWAKLETRPFTDETTSVTGKASAPAANPTPTPSPNLQAQREKIARAGFNFLNIPLHPPEQASASPTESGGIQRQEEEKQDLQMKPLADSIQRREIQEEEQKEETEPAVQLKCSECQQEEQEKKSESVQTKLTVGKPGDKYEQEADQMAAKVMAMPDTATQQPTQSQTQEKQEEVQMKSLANSITPLVQRSSVKQDEDVQMKPGQQKAATTGSDRASSLESSLASQKGGGSPLPDDVRSFMESRFSADFSGVRVHTDSSAVQMNKELGAQAFTHGSDIYYGAGKSPGQNDLTAHELTHVVQQTGAVKLKPNVGQQGNPSQPETQQAAVSGHTEDISIQPLCDKCEQERQQEEAEDKTEGTVQAKELPGHTPEVPSNLEDLMQSQQGGNQPLPKSTHDLLKTHMGHGFNPANLHPDAQRGNQPVPKAKHDLLKTHVGHDFNPASLHPDAQGIDAAQANNGYSHTRDNVKDAGQNLLATAGGKGAFPHDLTHIVQQPPTGDVTPHLPGNGLSDVAKPKTDLVANPVVGANKEHPPKLDSAIPKPKQHDVSHETPQAHTTANAQPLADIQHEQHPQLHLEENHQHEATSTAEHSSGLAEHAAAPENHPMPQQPAAVVHPQPVAHIDSGGAPIPPDPQTEAHIQAVAQKVQLLRQGGHQVQKQAAGARTNAGILRSNIAKMQQEIGKSEQGVNKASNHLTFRKGLVSKAQQAHSVSEQKATKVATQAPSFVNKAAGGKTQIGPVASGTAALSGQNPGQKSDDAEVQGKAQEQGQQLNKAGSDSAKISDAFTQAQTQAQSLVKDAAQAKSLNTQTKGKIDKTQKKLEQTDQHLSKMKQQNTQARTQLAGLSQQPNQMIAQAGTMDAHGQALIQGSVDIENRLHQVQQRYAAAIRSLPKLKPAQAKSKPPGGGSFIQRSPAPGASSKHTTEQVADDSSSERINVDVAGGVAKALPSWMTGVDPESQQQRNEAVRKEQQRRRDEVNQINQMAGGHFEKLSAADKMGIALKLTGQHIFSSVSQIQFPNFGQLALGLIDPRGPMMGVLSGLGMVISGGGNLFSAQQWAKDPVGNLITSSAQIATGLTIILGSIVALAGVIAAIAAAATILTLGLASPITGPIIAFCATVMTTVGGWTVIVGLVALALQGLVLIKDLYDAATAKTADALQKQSDQMTQDVDTAGNIVMQVGMAKLAQIGGRSMQAEIAEAGGGVNFAKNMAQPSRNFVGRAVTSVREGGLTGLASDTAGGVKNMASGVKSSLGALRQDVADAGGIGSYARQAGGSALRRGWRELTADTPKEFTGRQAFSRDFLVGGSEDSAALADMRAAGGRLRAPLGDEHRIGSGTEPENEPHAGTGATNKNEPRLGTSDELLNQTANKTGSQLSPDEVKGELDIVGHSEPKPISEGPYVEEVKLPNDHEWKRTSDGTWCRFSNNGECFNPDGTPVRNEPTSEPKSASDQVNDNSGDAGTNDKGSTVDIVNPESGKVFGRYSKGESLEIKSKGQLYGGNTIKLHPEKTTTLTGTLDDVNTVARRGEVSGATQQGANPGGINILRSPEWKTIQEKHIEILKSGNELRYWQTVTDEFWETVNKPWLDEAIARGDNFRFVSDPSDPLAIFTTKKGTTEFILDGSGNKIKSIFGREVDYLRSKGYTILPGGSAIKAS